MATLEEQNHEEVINRPMVRQFRLRLTYLTIPETIKYIDLNDNNNFFELSGDLGFEKNNTYYTYANYASVIDTAVTNKNIQGNLYFGYNKPKQEGYLDYQKFFEEVLSADHVQLEYWNLNDVYYRDVDIVSAQKTEFDHDKKILCTQLVMTPLSNWYTLNNVKNEHHLPEVSFGKHFIGENLGTITGLDVEYNQAGQYQYDNDSYNPMFNDTLYMAVKGNSLLMNNLSRFRITGTLQSGNQTFEIFLFDEDAQKMVAREKFDIKTSYHKDVYVDFENIYGEYECYYVLNGKKYSIYNNRDFNTEMHGLSGIYGIPNGNIRLVTTLKNAKLVVYTEKMTV